MKYSSIGEKSFFSICYNVLAAFTGKSDAAHFIQKLNYWLQKTSVGHRLLNGVKYVYNSYEEWSQQFPWLSSSQVGRIVRELESLGWIVTKKFHQLRREIGFIEQPSAFHDDNQRKWYTIDYKKIFEDTGFDLLSAEGKSLESALGANVHIRTKQCTSLHDDLYTNKTKGLQQVVDFEEISQTSGEVSGTELDRDSRHAGITGIIPGNQTQSPQGGQFSPAQPDGQKIIEIPRCEELRRNGVSLGDKQLIKAVAAYPERLQNSVAAFLEYCGKKQVNKPTRTLITAINGDWQPENTPITNNQPQDPKQALLKMLEIWQDRWDKVPMARPQMKRDIEDAYPGGEIVVTSDGRVVLGAS